MKRITSLVRALLLSMTIAPAALPNTVETESNGDVGQIFRMTETPDPIPAGEEQLGYDEFISSTWDTFLPLGYTPGDAYDPSATIIPGVFVERESRWTSTPYGDNTDVYPIYRYTFTPVNGYEKTVLLTSGCHGNEAEGYWGLYRLINMIYFEGDKYPNLGNLRDVRFIIIPSWNPWGLQHDRRVNAFEDAKQQAWNWLISSSHKRTVDGVVYDITDVGEANVIYETVNEYKGELSLWVDLHTDPYAGRDTTNVNIDNPHAYVRPYGCYGFAAADSNTYHAMHYVMHAFYNIYQSELNFTEAWHPVAVTAGASSFTGWQASLGFPCALIEISTFMDHFPYPSGSGELMKLTQEYFGNCIVNMLRTDISSSKPLSITTQPQDVTTPIGNKAIFTVNAEGESLRHQWQWSHNGEKTWEDSTSASVGYNTDTLQIAATAARNGFQYRCVITDAYGFTVISEAAALHVVGPLSITTQPHDVTAAVGDTARFKVAATGEGLTYRWQYKTPEGTWKNSGTAGYNTDTLTVSATGARNRYQYRCVVENAGGKAISSAATLTVITPPKITTPPKSQSAAAGTTVKFTVKATGEALSYQWYFRVRGSNNWAKCTGTGATAATMTVAAKAYRSGYQYRCKVSNAAGEVCTDAVTLTVTE